ncbi:MAG: hypothetical protein LAT77_04720 [Aliidiomarina sp.]|uniref:hypothetical protein n=1 Tax=Aliidiomarina sp. TaxID=1872439 RepID=UPI0025BAAFB9|nr:hypothetical protein [Aliidiomarina sp.]MCH8501202.1 hypothetical protein [Aliidiomarina sp.]
MRLYNRMNRNAGTVARCQSSFLKTLIVVGVFNVLFIFFSSESHANNAAIEADSERELILIAAYDYAPYFISGSDEHFLGQLVTNLNALQTRYRFEIREVRPHDRYAALGPDGCCDLMFFESENWGWKTSGYSYAATPGILKGCDRLYSMQNDYWEPKETDRIGGVVGYHYQLTNMNTDILYSEIEHKMYRANNQLTLLNMLRHGRIQFAMLSEEFVHWMAAEAPETVAGLYASPEHKEVYETQIILSNHSALDQRQFFRDLERLAAQPEIKAQIKRYQLQLTSFSSVIDR